MQYGEVIHAARERAGLSQHELAEAAGTTQSAVSAYERGRRAPTLSTLERLLHASGARLDLRAVYRPPLPSAVLARRRREVLDCAHRHGASRVLVFGSVARGEDTEGSDIDLLMDLPPTASLLDVVGVQQEIADLLGVDVDVGTPESLRPEIRDAVLAEARPL